MPSNAPQPEPPAPTPSATTCRCGHDKSQHFGMETPHCRECLRLRRAGYIHDFVPPASAPAATPEPEPCEHCSNGWYWHDGRYHKCYSCNAWSRTDSRPAAPASEARPVPVGSTHYVGCWRSVDPTHANCAYNAMLRAESRLTAQATELAALWARVEEIEALLTAFVAWDDDDDEDTPNRWDSLDTLCNSARAALAPRQTTET